MNSNTMNMTKWLLVFMLSNGVMGNSMAQSGTMQQGKNEPVQSSSIETKKQVEMEQVNPELKFRSPEFFIINDKPVSKEQYLEYLMKKESEAGSNPSNN